MALACYAKTPDDIENQLSPQYAESAEGIKPQFYGRSTTKTIEIKRKAVIVAIKAKQEFRNCQTSTSRHIFICKARKELLNENDRDELAAMRKRKQHCQRSIDSLIHSLRTPEFVRRVQGMA
ncbi:hypothetical protein ACTXT7_006542 [Hymenolepis weldensis]